MYKFVSRLTAEEKCNQVTVVEFVSYGYYITISKHEVIDHIAKHIVERNNLKGKLKLRVFVYDHDHRTRIDTIHASAYRREGVSWIDCDFRIIEKN